MKKISNEFKVGIFVLSCLVGLFYLTYSTGKLNIRKKGYTIKVVFSDIAGLQPKAPVLLNGMDAGKVEDIKLSLENGKSKIILTVWLDDKVKVGSDAAASIKTLGLMGEKYIQLASSNAGDFLKPGAVLEGRQYLDMDAMMEQVQTISKQVTDQVNALLANLNSEVDNNKGNVTQIIKNLEVTTKNFEEFSADIKSHPWKLLFKGKEQKAK